MAAAAAEVLKKLGEIEAGNACLRHEMSLLRPNQQARSASPRRARPAPAAGDPCRTGTSEFGASRLRRAGDGIALTDRMCLNILQSMGRSVHIHDLDGVIIYWNRTAEEMYSYSVSEALGQDAIELLVDAHDYDIASDIIQQCNDGESWSGNFPVKNKLGDRFLAMATNAPLYDDDGSLVGITCVSSDSRSFQEIISPPISTNPSTFGCSSSNQPINIGSKGGAESQQPLPVAIASKLSTLATKVTNKVRSRMKTYENSSERDTSSGGSQCSDHGNGATIPIGDAQSPSGSSSYVVNEEKSPGQAAELHYEEGEKRTGIQNIFSSKAEAWISKKGIPWLHKGNGHDRADAKNRNIWPWLHADQENDYSSEVFCI